MAVQRALSSSQFTARHRELLEKQLGWDSAAAASLLRAAQGGKHADAYMAFLRYRADAAVLLELLTLRLPRERANAVRNPQEAALDLAWSWTYLMSAAVEGYRSAGDRRFQSLAVDEARQVLQLRDAVTGRRDESVGRPSKAWTSQQQSSSRPVAIMTHAGRICDPILNLVHVSRQRKQDFADSPDFVSACEDALREFERDVRVVAGSAYILRRGTERAEPLNHAHAYARALVHLRSLKSAEWADRLIRQLGQHFRKVSWIEPNGTVVWPYAAGPGARSRRAAEPYWKAHITLGFPWLAYERGVEFTRAEIDAFAHTFLRNVVRPTGVNTLISWQTFEPLEKGRRELRHRAAGLAGWMLSPLRRHEIEAALVRVMVERPSIFPSGWLGAPVLVQAYALKLN